MKTRILLLIAFISSNLSVTFSQQDYFLISNFENPSEEVFYEMGNIAISIAPNPEKSEKNSSNYVLKIDGLRGNDHWHGIYSRILKSFHIGVNEGQYRYIHFKVYKSFVSEMLFTVKRGQTEYYPESKFNSETNAWEYITIDLLTGSWAPQAGEYYDGLNFAMHKNTPVPSSYTAYVDDILLSNSTNQIYNPTSTELSYEEEENLNDDNPDGTEWELIFQDDFNGTKVNEKDWYMYNSPGHDGNGLRRPEAFTVADGILTVTAQMINGQIVSGGMANRINITYGKFEVRVRADDDPSLATSAVLLTWPQSENWPVDGENDFFETLLNRRQSFHTYIHYGADNKTFHKEHRFNVQDWLVVAMEWEPDWIKIYVNGSLQWTLTASEAIPHVPHHLCIQLDAFKKIMTGIVTMQVDWVKIYSRSLNTNVFKPTTNNEEKWFHVFKNSSEETSVRITKENIGKIKMEVYTIDGRLSNIVYEGQAVPDDYIIGNSLHGIHILKIYTNDEVYNFKF